MTHEQYARVISAIGDHSTPDALAASVPGVPADEIRRVWDAYHMSVRGLRAATGLSQARFAERFLIPTRTLENWERGVNECPIYTRMMIADTLGFLPPRC